MRKMHLEGSWTIHAPREEVYKIISDFENMPKNFPAVAHSMKIVEQKGNDLIIEGKAKSFRKILDVKMRTKLIPMKGFISDNESDLVSEGHEEFMLEKIPQGTRINYTYDITLRSKIVALVSTPLIKWFSMWFWKRAFIDRLKEMLEK